ncbi:MAG: dppD [Ilumatobacteraceae bacterium]|nr:dppD [Ilumatobacteraceae bacterium]
MGSAVLEVEDLDIYFQTLAGEVQAVDHLSLSIDAGEMVGLVGESGSGKSVTALAIMGLLPRHLSRVTGRVVLRGRDLIGLDDRRLERVRGREVSMIFQEPMTALDPVYKVGDQIAETLRAHRKVSRRAARARALELIDAVGIPDAARRAEAYPHQLSGGMRQRILIAISLVAEPAVLIADEPTTALDVTIQAQILELLHALSAEQGTAILLITHDLGVVAEACSRVVTMYAGQVVEQAAVDEILELPAHPYTSGLIRSIPQGDVPKSELYTIRGRVPALSEMPSGCRFQPRCDHAAAQCAKPQPIEQFGDRLVRCCRHAELDLPGAVSMFGTT